MKVCMTQADIHATTGARENLEIEKPKQLKHLNGRTREVDKQHMVELTGQVYERNLGIGPKTIKNKVVDTSLLAEPQSQACF